MIVLGWEVLVWVDCDFQFELFGVLDFVVQGDVCYFVYVVVFVFVQGDLFGYFFDECFLVVFLFEVYVCFLVVVVVVGEFELELQFVVKFEVGFVVEQFWFDECVVLDDVELVQCDGVVDDFEIDLLIDFEWDGVLDFLSCCRNGCCLEEQGNGGQLEQGLLFCKIYFVFFVCWWGVVFGFGVGLKESWGFYCDIRFVFELIGFQRSIWGGG